MTKMQYLKFLHDFNLRPIPYHRLLTQMTGRLTAGVLLSFILERMDMEGTDKVQIENFDVMAATSLTSSELRTAKNILKSMPWMTITREGLPPCTCYQIDWELFRNHVRKLERP